MPAKKVLDEMLMTRPGFRSRAHLVGGRAGDDEGPGQIDVDDFAPMFEIDIVPGDEGHDRRIVDENVDAACLLDLVEHRRNRLRIRNVDGDGTRLAADGGGSGLCAIAR